MTWLKLDDGFHRHTKIAPLSDKAWRLHVTVLCECAAKLTDGRLPRRLLPVLPGAPRARSLEKFENELVDAGVWRIEGDEIVVHDYLEWNPSAAKVLELQEKRSRAGRSRGKQVLNTCLTSAEHLLSKTETKSEPVPVPVPIDKTHPPTPLRGGAVRTDGQDDPTANRPEYRAFERRFAVGVEAWSGWTDGQRDRIVALGRDPDREHADFSAYWRAEGKRLLDWSAKADLRVQQLEDRHRERSGATSGGELTGVARWHQDARAGRYGPELRESALAESDHMAWFYANEKEIEDARR